MSLPRAVLRYGGAAIALLLAPVLALQAQVNAGGRAPAWALHWNGFRLADLARSQFAFGLQEGTFSLAVPPETQSLAREAFAREPFASDALPALAYADSTLADSQQAQILGLAHRLDQRNLIVGLDVLQRALARDDLPEAQRLIDQLARIRPEVASDLVRTLVDAGSVPFWAEILRRNPPLAEQFWRSVPRKDPQLANFVALRQLLSPPANEANDARLIQALVGVGRYSDAMRLWGEATGNRDSATGFSNTARFAPIDWQLARRGSAYAGLAADGALEVFVDSGATGELARQLVALAPGRYRWSGTVTLDQGSGRIDARLQCAPDAPDAARWSRQPAGAPAYWQVPPGACRYAWLVIEGSAWDSPVPLRATIRAPSFARAE